MNLAFFNLIPFPPLDGSRVLIIVLEKILKKKLRTNWESKIYTVGMMILLLLVVLLTYRELPKLISAGSFSKFIDSLMK
ncbi:site-2 protease family protein [Candidatus Woesebacteria bacterium]|nr:site-2 protease family protein [Candidatus Woesebacteria bacterium]